MPGWEALGGGFDTNGGPALVPGDGGSIDLYVPYTGSLYRKNQAGGIWGAWSSPEVVSMPGSVTMSAGVSAALAGGNTVWMAARGSDSASWYRTRSLGGAWGSWALLGGSTPYAPAISASSSGNVLVWSSGNDNNLYMKRYSGGRWGGWAAYVLPGSVLTTGAAAAVGDSSNHVYVAVLGRDSNYYVGNWDDATATWNGWTNLGHGGSTTGLQPPALSFGRSIVNLWAADSTKLWQQSFVTSWNGWTDAPSTAGGATVVPPPATAPAALATSTGDVNLVVRTGSTGDAYYRAYHPITPSPTVVLSPDRVVLGTTSSGQVGCEHVWPWESVSLVVPPNKASCGSSGAVIYDTSQDVGAAPSVQHQVFKGTLDCYQNGVGLATDGLGNPLGCTGSNSNRCGSSQYNIYSQAAGWPTGLTLLGGVPPNGGGFGSADDQLARVGGAGSTLLLLKGAQLKTNATYTSPTSRGGFIPYMSADCASNWSMSSKIVDPCDSSLGYSTNYCSDGHGLDHPDLAVSPAFPATAWIGTSGINASTGQSDSVLYATSNNGNTWAAQVNATDGTPVVIAKGALVEIAPVGNSLAVAYAIDEGSPCKALGGSSPALASLDSLGHFAINKWDSGGVLKSWFTTDCMQWASNQLYTRNLFTTSPVGQYWNTQQVRVAYPMLSGSDQIFRVRALQWQGGAGGQLSDLGHFDISSATGSVFHLNAIYPNRLDSAPPSTVVMYYWYETSGHAPNYGTATVKGCIVRDLETTCTPFPLALDGGNSVRWWQYTGDPQAPGDYLKGSFFYDPADPNGQTLHFFAHWMEWPASNPQQWSVHTNIVKVAP